MFKNAKAGDKVWSILCGWTQICSVNKRHTYPITIKNKNSGITHHFNFFGFRKIGFVSEGFPSLFWDEIKLEDLKPSCITPPEIEEKQLFIVTTSGLVPVYDIKGNKITNKMI